MENSNSSKYLVDVIIPCYNEKGYIEKTLDNLSKQLLYVKGKVHIAIGDFKNELNMDDVYLYELCKQYGENITYVPIFHKGIAYARNETIRKASKTDIIMNFDADSVFNRLDAIDRMIDPIVNQEALFTNCGLSLYDAKGEVPTGNNENFAGNIFNILHSLGNQAEKYFFARAPGLTVNKAAFLSVGGFRDLPVAEDYWLAFDLQYKYSVKCKRFVKDVMIYTSDRRAKASDKEGIAAVFDYAKNYYR